ncbi:alanine--tRNA ligase [Candidatus Parcubacteria bacterium]|nr:alanine--tRNA ligase [Patescibacteria group bacterium]MBU4466962.1 alanine--tRNA ligase [Patescibacteria group bacterium]MCG2688750.1 alanine--tRNA ligase [Candidatus Parcubacteria bacterium]
MTAKEIRQKYFEFFKNRGHAIIPAAALVCESDPTTLFTSSGMQPLVPYLLGESHPLGKRLVDSQPCLRLEDIDEVGDNRHTTFFEMLGNWSLGDYFKAEQLPWIYEFLTQELGLSKDRLWVSVFSAEGGPASGGEGDKNANVPWDEESFAIWKKIGIPENRILFYGPKKNWWSRSGPPDKMPVGEIGGPDSEIFFEFIDIHHDSKYGLNCHPNCDCGRFMEIGNSVFIEYMKKDNGALEELPLKNVDFGGGLERLVAAVNNNPDIFKIDLLWPLVEIIQSLSKKDYHSDKNTSRAMRIMADHFRAAVMIAREGIQASNKTQGYILRRLLRRAMLFARRLNLTESSYLKPLVRMVCKIYVDIFPDLKDKETEISAAFQQEADCFDKALKNGLREIEKVEKLDGKTAFYIYESFGFPLEMILEIVKERGQEFNLEEFEEEQKKHQDLSRQAAEGMFKGGLADQSHEVVKLHTATHLLHQALREVLGEGVKQEGSNITAERLRFDFSHSQKMTLEELKNVEDLVNEKIGENLEVSFVVMDKDQALKSGVRAFFKEKYADKVKVYNIGPSMGSGSPFSREICGGPHISKTSELGRFKIIKEEAVAKGIRRIRASLENS